MDGIDSKEDAYKHRDEFVSKYKTLHPKGYNPIPLPKQKGKIKLDKLVLLDTFTGEKVYADSVLQAARLIKTTKGTISKLVNGSIKSIKNRYTFISWNILSSK